MPDYIRPTGPPINEEFCMLDSERSIGSVDFNALVHLKTPIVSILKPPVGYINIIKSSLPIKRITVAFLKLETIINSEGKMAIYQTEVSKSSIAENDPPIQREYPFMIEWQHHKMGQPMDTPKFSISYALRSTVVWINGATATYDIPLVLFRDMEY